MSYQKQLQSGTWQERRLRIMERDKFKCVKCGKKDYLEIHHIDYWDEHKAWEYPDDMLLTLCRPCHSEEKNRPKHEMHLLTAFNYAGFTAFDLLHLSVLLHSDKGFVQDLKAKLRGNN